MSLKTSIRHMFARKPLKMLQKEMADDHRLRRVLGPWSLASLGIGCIIGAGIFVITGLAARYIAGPALIVSFVVAGAACIFAALCYGEFASMTPVAGSAYTYSYATLGELFAWIIGWDLILEFTVASATVAHGWSKYFQNFIGMFGLKLPQSLSTSPFDFVPGQGYIPTGGVFDLPAISIALILTVVLVLGIRESTRFNNVMVAVKLAVVALVIGVGAFYINPANWKPFAPYGWTGVAVFGHTIFGQTSPEGAPIGMLAASAIIFFAYVGFDSVATHAEEAKNPQKDIPFGIIASLIICTFLYIAVTAVLTGMVGYDKIDIQAPIAAAFQSKGLHWAQFIISLGAVAGITSVILVLMLSQPRVLLAMARDGLLPKSFFGAVHPVYRTPWKSTIMTGLIVGTMAALVPLGILAELVNIGTLLAFVMVCLAVLIMRYTNPKAARPFRCPWVPFVPVMGVLSCTMLMFSLPSENWLRLIVWLVAGMFIYLLYGRHHSVMFHHRKGTAKKA
jgi:APA family basic amino acid/polyamine antiporter